MIQLLAALGGSIIGFFTQTAARYAVLKFLIFLSFWALLPLALDKFLLMIIERSLSFASTQTGSLTAATIQLTGLAAWIGGCLNLGSGLSVFLSFVSARFTLLLFRVV